MEEWLLRHFSTSLLGRARSRFSVLRPMSIVRRIRASAHAWVPPYAGLGQSTVARLLTPHASRCTLLDSTVLKREVT